MQNGLEVFLLGAGASHGSGGCEPHAPPLAVDLFARLLERPTFRELIPERFVPHPTSFEATLSKLWDEHADRMIPVLNEIALYFSEFRPAPGNLYVELGRRIRQHADRTVLASLNADMLLEMSLFGSGVPCYYEGTLPARGAMILKPHGSINFLPTLAGTSVTEGSLHRAMELAGLEHCNAIQVVADPAQIHRYIDSTGLPPMIAAFMPKKPIPYCRAVIRDFWTTWQRVVRGATRLTLIGVDLDGAGPHIWDPLLALRGNLDYVGSDPAAAEKLARMAPRSSRVSVVAPTFEQYLRTTQPRWTYHLW
jgi:hypothetical protein